jgi:uncharacterized short protein YbdD (DUF466 family)
MDIKKFLPVTLASLAILAAITIGVSANNDTGTAGFTTPRSSFRGMTHGNRAAVETAIQANDYDAWIKAMGDKNPMANIITKDNFAKFVSMHQLMKDGKFDEAKQIADELGLKMPGKGAPQGPKINEAADTSITNGDYNAWVNAVSTNDPLLKVITKDNFLKYAEAYNDQKQAMELMKKSRDIMEELGVKGPGFGMMGKGGHMGGRRGGFFGEPREESQQPTE